MDHATGYQVKHETVHGIGADLQIRSLLDRQQFHDPLGEAEKLGILSAAWPIFGLLWPSGRVLADTMLSYEIKGRRFLEVGCGLALASIVLHRRGGDVTAGDCHPLAGAFLHENLVLNHLPAMKYTPADWRQLNGALGLFDVIIGSDVLYDREQPEILSQFIDRHSEINVEVLIVDPNRGNQGSFSRKMVALGYAHSAASVHELPAGGGPFKGKLHRYNRNAFIE